MANYRIAATLSATNAAYIAGLVDADGTVTLCRKHQNENHQLADSISNTDRRLLEFARQSAACGIITRKRTTKQRHTPSHAYAVYNRQALRLLEQITTYLKTYTSKRARMILDQYIKVTPRNGKYTQELKPARNRFVRNILGTKPTYGS